MALHDEIARLAALREAGTLTEAEFVAAKAKLLAGDQETLGRAANKAVNLSAVWGVIVLVLILAFFFLFFLPQWNKTDAQMQSGHEAFDRQFQQSREQFGKSLNQGALQESGSGRLEQAR